MSANDDASSGRRRDGRRTPREGTGTPLPIDVSSDIRNRRSIALFVAAPVIWSAHFMLVYLVAEAGCTGDGPGLGLFDPPVPTAVTLVATAAATLACLLTASVSYRRWRANRAQTADGGGPGQPDGDLDFAGLMMSLLGVLTVLSVGLPALVLRPC
jgi:hypothetical protein